MINDCQECDPKIYTYKVKGMIDYCINMPTMIGILSQMNEVIPTSIKVYDLGARCKFKFKGTKKALRDLILLGTKFDFNVEKVKRVWF